MTMNEHERPLAPGEVRKHVVGSKTFGVMHVAGGSYTQAAVVEGGTGPTKVLCTSVHEDVAVHAYAQAIAEADQPSPALADDVAELRSLIETFLEDFPSSREQALGLLDRIAERAS